MKGEQVMEVNFLLYRGTHTRTFHLYTFNNTIKRLYCPFYYLIIIRVLLFRYEFNKIYQLIKIPIGSCQFMSF